MKKKRLLIYFCICLALLTLLGVSFFYLRKLNALEKNNERVDHSYKVILQTNLLEQNLLNAETSQRGYLLSGKADFLELYVDELKDIPAIFRSMDELTADNREQQSNLDTLQVLVNLQLNTLKKNMAGDPADSIPMARFRESARYMGRIRDVITSIKAHEASLLNERNLDKSKNTSESKRRSLLSLFVAFALCCIASVIIIWFFNRSEIYRADLEDKLLKLTTLNDEVRELAIASAHNLQEPMRKVQMVIDWLQHMQEVKDSGMNEQLNRIKEIYNKQQVINNKIIEYYDILLNPGTREKINLNTFIEELARRHNWSAQLTLTVEALKDVEADPQQLELLFVHLIHNALQYSHPQRPLAVRIHQTLARERLLQLPLLKSKTYYCIAVSDNGTGIAKEYFPKIFNLFQKLESSNNNAVQSGMGLSFCKRIMLNHGGNIAARKNDPFGLSILLFFPAF